MAQTRQVENRQEPFFRHADFLEIQIVSFYIFFVSVIGLSIAGFETDAYLNVGFWHLLTLYAGNRTFWTYVVHKHSNMLTEFMFGRKKNLCIAYLLIIYQIYISCTYFQNDIKDLNHTTPSAQ